MKPPDAILGGLGSKKEKNYLQNLYFNLSSRTCKRNKKEQLHLIYIIFIL